MSTSVHQTAAEIEARLERIEFRLHKYKARGSLGGLTHTHFSDELERLTEACRKFKVLRWEMLLRAGL